MKSSMKRSPNAYNTLRQLGFADAEIAPWVKRPEGVPSSVDKTLTDVGAPLETPSARTDVRENHGEGAPIGQGFTGSVNEVRERVHAGANALVPKGATKRAYKGYAEATLKQMNTNQLKELGLTRTTSDGEIYIPSQEENGRIILDPLPEAPPETEMPPEGSPMAGIVID